MNISKADVYRIHNVPSPEDLDELVRRLPDVPDIEIGDYARAIMHLHEVKGYSFSEIVSFLGEQGIETNRSAVYRVYKEGKTLGPAREDPLIDDETGEVVEE